MRKFDPSTDFSQFKEWHERRGMKVPDDVILPMIGLIVDGVAAGFLIQTDCALGFLDFFVTNPLASKEERNDALDDIGFSLIVTAKRLGVKALMCNTKFKNIKALAHKHGFNYLGEYSSFSRGII